MELTKVKINNYKSIENPIEIDLNGRSHYITFIGKNGSGKTNILRALKAVLSKHSLYGIENYKSGIVAEYELSLTDQEQKEYFPFIENENKILVKMIGNEPQLKTIQAPMVAVSIKEFREELADVLQKFRAASKNYLLNLRMIEQKETSDIASYLDLDIKDEKGLIFALRKERIDRLEEDLKKQQAEIETVLKNYSGDEITLNEYERYPLTTRFLYSLSFYEIADMNLSISPIIAKSLGLDKESIATANKKLNRTIKQINKSLKDSYLKIQEQITRYEDLKKEIISIFSTKEDEQFQWTDKLVTTKNHFLQTLKDSVFANGYYIDNENSLFFSSDRYQNEQRVQRHQEYLNTTNPIIEAFDIYLKENEIYRKDESITHLDKMSNERLSEIIDILNHKFLQVLIPDFDKQANVSYSLELNGKNMALCVIEQNGKKISINETSLGRRWYLTYKLVSKLLKPGDYLFIDEPAAFLHPQAQLEIKRELENLSKQGIYVFITTHSPYMISDNWANVISVSAGANGTEIKRFESSDSLSKEIISELGDIRSSDILFNLSKTILLVEGTTDKACIEKFAELLKYDLEEWYIIPCNGSPIFDVTYLCIDQNIKFKALFDLDNKNKPDEWMKKRYGYKEYLKIFDENENCVFTPELRTNSSLEDCFSEQDQSLYFSDYEDKKGTKRKIDAEKVKAAAHFEKETMDNFEQLFKKIGLKRLANKKN